MKVKSVIIFAYNTVKLALSVRFGSKAVIHIHTKTRLIAVIEMEQHARCCWYAYERS